VPPEFNLSTEVGPWDVSRHGWTIRFIAWMNEEFGGSGYSQYIEDHKAELARHAANIEIDNGSGHPVGYTAYANGGLLDALSPMNPILNQMSSGIVQVARSPLGDLDQYMPGFEPRTDMRNYYDYHHTAADTLDKIDPQGLRENSALLAVLSYMLVNLDRSHATPGSK
jgi:carboxypeptidase Q